MRIQEPGSYGCTIPVVFFVIVLPPSVSRLTTQNSRLSSDIDIAELDVADEVVVVDDLVLGVPY